MLRNDKDDPIELRDNIAKLEHAHIVRYFPMQTMGLYEVPPGLQVVIPETCFTSNIVAQNYITRAYKLGEEAGFIMHNLKGEWPVPASQYSADLCQ